MPTVFMVAEKPSLAESIAKILSFNKCISRKGFNHSCSVHEWTGRFMGYGNAFFRMTSVCGHVMTSDFPSKYNDWENVDPATLFKAKVIKKEANPKLKMPAFLQKEATNCDLVVLWLDCDKEGENICFEVIDCIQECMNCFSFDNVFRARFSSITEKDIRKAFANLVYPNENEAKSVDARQILDLRLGCAFTRFQTRYFQGKYANLDSSCISYGPCQTPTLGFCVQRYDDIQSFHSEPYWILKLEIKHGNEIIKLNHFRSSIFDKEVALTFLNIVKLASKATVIDVKKEKVFKGKPRALNTVEMLRAASSRKYVNNFSKKTSFSLGMSPSQAMAVAEQLYVKGLISYPRTETTQYSKNFDFIEPLNRLKTNTEYAEFVNDILKNGMDKPRSGKDVGDHPPITPVASPSGNLSSDMMKLYDFIVRHFIATISPDCVLEQTTVTVKASSEIFSSTYKTVMNAGWTAVMRFKTTDDEYMNVPNVEKSEELEIHKVSLDERHTVAPDYVTESELIALMEKHGIGTDASIPVHINNICERNYVRVEGSKRFLIPSPLGIVLIHGYQRIDPELCKPHMRSSVESQLALIAEGKADFGSVLEHACTIFEQKFHYFVQNIEHMDSLFDDSFSTLDESGKVLSRCGKCYRYMKLTGTSKGKLQRLHCETCKETYNLPSSGQIRNFRELRCPLDDFELVVHLSPEGKSKHLCPYCYNNPPFVSMKQGDFCSQCDHPTCAQSINSNGLAMCFSCNEGIIMMDVCALPKILAVCTT